MGAEGGRLHETTGNRGIDTRNRGLFRGESGLMRLSAAGALPISFDGTERLFKNEDGGSETLSLIPFGRKAQSLRPSNTTDIFSTSTLLLEGLAASLRIFLW